MVLHYLNSNSYKKIMQYLEKYYPNLLKTVLNDVRSNKKLVSHKKRNEKIMFQLFTLSPKIFLRIYKIYNIIKKYIKSK